MIATSTLWSHICSGAQNIVTALDDDAGAFLGSVCPPLGGRYSTGGGLTAFDGAEGAGKWTLEVDDTTAGDMGMLLNWSITMTTARQ